ncbi:MAG: type II secretion system F family protein, partial [Hydrogenophaga sp.]|nr:type II secretion system F family protein [Hydrogenophaga sp.]
MPAYTFEALDAQGATQKGLIDADTARSARSLLRARALVPLMVEPATGGGTNVQGSGLNVTLWGGRVFSATTLAVWTRQMAGLVAAGLPLERALSALTEEAEDDKQRNLMASLRSEVNAGSPFAQALAQHPREFSSIYTSVIAAGEQSGQLGTVLERLADDLEEREALKNKLVAASLYPAIVTLVAIVIVVFLVSYVVPQVANVFAGSKRALPLLTVMMLGLSDFVRSYGWLMLGALVLGSGALVMARRNEALRLRMDAAWLRLPLVGRLARGFNAARFAATLAMLAAAGVPILRA